jgi:uncharacterized protein DUF6152
MSHIDFKNAACALMLAMSVVATGAYAHHSFAAQYDSNKPVTLNGVITKVEWTNPHVYLYVDVKGKGGKVANWGVEMGPPHMLQRTGWKKNSLSIGEQVAIDGWLARDGSNHANARRVMRSKTGEVLGAASSAGQTLTGGGAGAGANTGSIGSSQTVPAPTKPAGK